MKLTSILFLLSVLVPLIIGKKFSILQSKTPPEIQERSVEELIQRIIPDAAYRFDVQITSNNSENDEDYFTLEKNNVDINGTIKITASNGVAAASGFHYYLKYFCNSHISWEGSHLNLPKFLPNVNLTITFNDRFRYYQNACTTSYSFVWWNWEKWEQHIDWMVLNGFNLVLAFNGQEAIWDRIYRRLNMTLTEINDHFTGPAFLSWLRMGNMRGWGGGLSPTWLSKSILLQKQILERMRNLGIIPVLPAFAGHVPIAFKRLYPDAKMTQMSPWNHFEGDYCCPYFLEPTDPLFNEVGRMFLEELTNEFGTDHIYNCDSFNENTPSSGDLVYLSDVGKSIYKAMTDVDADAIWLMQNWLFVHDFLFWTNERAKALITAVPQGKMIILDLQSEQFPQYERLNQYYGQPFIWCMLHNFGGTLGMFGSSNIINEEPIIARNSPNSTMIGIGLTPEGINQNYVIYDLMTENAWRKQPVNLTTWFEQYSVRRYGIRNANASSAWKILQHTIYDYNGLNKMRGKYAITTSPSLKFITWSWYRIEDLITAWNFLLDAADSLSNNSLYRHDLVDVTRQVLQVIGDSYYEEMIKAYKESNIVELENKSTNFLEVFHDLEVILLTNEAFLLNPWLESAKKCANDLLEEQLFEYNARNQITLWGPKGEIMNYANKQWAGVVSKFFEPRWSLFISYMKETLTNGTDFNQAYIKEKMFKEVEEPFTFDRTIFPPQPQGDTVDEARKIRQRWFATHRRIPRKPSSEGYKDIENLPEVIAVNK